MPTPPSQSWDGTSASTSHSGSKLNTTSYKTYTPFPTTIHHVPRSNNSPSVNMHLLATIPQLIACASPLSLDKDTKVGTAQAKANMKEREVTEIVLTGRVCPISLLSFDEFLSSNASIIVSSRGYADAPS